MREGNKRMKWKGRTERQIEKRERERKVNYFK